MNRVPSAGGVAVSLLFVAIGLLTAKSGMPWFFAGYLAIAIGGGALGATLRGFRDLVGGKKPDFVALSIYGSMLSTACLTFSYYVIPLVLGGAITPQPLSAEALLFAALGIGMFHEDVWRAVRALFNRELAAAKGDLETRLSRDDDEAYRSMRRVERALPEDRRRIFFEEERKQTSLKSEALEKELMSLQRKLASAIRSRDHWKKRAQRPAAAAPRKLKIDDGNASLAS